ncbi:MAG: rod shape-determining protein RodA [Treponema sp.]|nr:rod shape-determining protein RodA [Treponema sp.]
MKLRFNILGKFDYILIICITILSSMGIMFIYSSGINSEGVNVSNEYQKQMIWFGVGFVLMVTFTLFDFRRFKRYALYIAAASIAILMYTMFFGKNVNGSHSWIGIKNLGIQPSEPVKIAYVIFLAWYLDKSTEEDDLHRFIKALVIMMVPMALILGQPDLGTATVYLPIFLFMCFIAGIPTRYIMLVLGIGATTSIFTILPIWQSEIAHRTIPAISILTDKKLSILVIATSLLVTALCAIGLSLFRKRYYYWLTYGFGIVTAGLVFSLGAGKVLKPYQIQRLIVFIDPSSDSLGAGWNIIQSKIAIGSGGLLGRGFLRGTQSHYRFLPEQSTDFIFSILSEESGFIGGLILFLCFFIILVRCVRIIRKNSNSFGILIVAGILGMFFYHFCLNVGMVMGIMPVAGIPLPFLSYGGSALITNMSAIGLVMGIHARRLDFQDNVL